MASGGDAARGAGAPDEPAWLDASEEQAWLAVAMLMLQVPRLLDAEMHRDCGMSLFDYLVVSSLSMAPDRTMRMSDLAAMVNGTLTRLSNVVKRLESAGWLERRIDPTDGRFTVAVLTDKGVEVVTAAAPAHVAAVRRLVVDPLSRRQLEQLAGIGATLGPIVRGE